MKLIVAFRDFANVPKNGTAVNAACQGNLSACHFGHTCHMLASIDIGVNRIIILKWMLRKFYAWAWTGFISVRTEKWRAVLNTADTWVS